MRRPARRIAPEEATVELWQIVLLAFFVLLPMALLLDFWPDRERLTRSGAPIEREWKRQVTHGPADEHH